MKKKVLIICSNLILVITLISKEAPTRISLKNKLYNNGNEAQNAIELIKSKMNDESITTYETGNKGEMYTFNHDATIQTPAQTDYRYIGSNPNNYIKFNCDSDGTNCETWRILGIFSIDDGTGNIEERIKIVKDNGLESKMAWNNSEDSNSKNDWENSSLNTFLNGDYYNQTGDAINYGLKESARNMIDNVVFYLGGSANDNLANQNAEDLYNWERGTTNYHSNNFSTSSTGNVGLMYPSDGYLVYGKGVNESCYNNPNGCRIENEDVTTSWIYNSIIAETGSETHNTWLISPFARHANHAVAIDGTGFFNNGKVTNTFIIRPVVYLKSNVNIYYGDGTVDNSYSLFPGKENSDEIIDNEEEIINNEDADKTDTKEENVTVANTLNYLSWTIIIVSIIIIILGGLIIGYTFYYSKRNKKDS